MTGWLARLAPLVLLALLAALWETASRSGFADPRLLPPLSEVLRVLAGLLQDERFRGDLAVTLSEIAVAFAIVGPLGLAVGFFLGESLGAYRMFAPTLHRCSRPRSRSFSRCSFSPSASASCRRSSSPSPSPSSSSC
ncbi:MAG: hypothetical protein WBW74_08820 [Xanthobacteraceae bacterium]